MSSFADADESISLHRMYGSVIGIAVVGHVACHMNNFVQLVTPSHPLFAREQAAIQYPVVCFEMFPFIL